MIRKNTRAIIYENFAKLTKQKSKFERRRIEVPVVYAAAITTAATIKPICKKKRLVIATEVIMIDLAT